MTMLFSVFGDGNAPMITWCSALHAVQPVRRAISYRTMFPIELLATENHPFRRILPMELTMWRERGKNVEIG